MRINLHLRPTPNEFCRQRPRWSATVTYRTDGGPLDVEHLLEELADLHDLIERGPHWDSVLGINIQRIDPVEPGITVEKAL